MATFFQQQMDFIFFLYGLGFLMVGTIALTLAKDPRQNIPWIWFGLFGLFHGVNEWLDFSSAYLFHNHILDIVRLTVLIGSFLLLTEFGRVSLVQSGVKVPGRWSLVPLVAIVVAAGFPLKDQGIGIIARYVLGCGGGLVAAWGLWSATQRQKDSVRPWLCGASVLLAVYAISQTVVPRAAFPPASLINVQSFFAVSGIPVQFLRGILALMMAGAVWIAGQKLYDDEDQMAEPVFKRETVVFVLVVVTTIGGWVLTESLTRREEKQIYDGLLSQARMAAASIDPDGLSTIPEEPQTVSNPIKERLFNQMAMLRHSVDDIQYICLMGFRSGRFFLISDARPKDSNYYEFVRGIYQETSPFLRRVFLEGRPLVSQPLRDRSGKWFAVAAPVKDHVTKEVVAILGMDVQVGDWDRTIAGARLPGIITTLALCAFLLGFIVVMLLTVESSAKIRTSENRFKMIFQHTPEAAFIMDLASGKFLEINPFMAHLLGYAYDALRRLTWDEIFAVKLHEIEDDIEESSRHNEVFRHEYFCYNKSGKPLWVEVIATHIRYQERDCFLVFMHDIDSRKKMEQKLKDSERYFRALIESAMDIITILEPDGTIRFESPSVQGVLGYAPEELVGRNVIDFVHPDDQPRVREAIQEGLQEQDSYRSMEIRYRHRDGSWHVLDCRGRNRMEDHAIRGIVVNSRDITKRKVIEDELEARIEDLRRFKDATVDREKQMAELKREINKLSLELGRPAPYNV